MTAANIIGDVSLLLALMLYPSDFQRSAYWKMTDVAIVWVWQDMKRHFGIVSRFQVSPWLVMQSL